MQRLSMLKFKRMFEDTYSAEYSFSIFNAPVFQMQFSGGMTHVQSEVKRAVCIRIFK